MKIEKRENGDVYCYENKLTLANGDTLVTDVIFIDRKFGEFQRWGSETIKEDGTIIIGNLRIFTKAGTVCSVGSRTFYPDKKTVSKNILMDDRKTTGHVISKIKETQHPNGTTYSIGVTVIDENGAVFKSEEVNTDEHGENEPLEMIDAGMECENKGISVELVNTFT